MLGVNRTDKILTVPASGVKSGITDVMYKIGDYIKNKFPEGFFKSYHYDTKDGFMSHYANLKRKEIKGQNVSYTKQEKPRLIMLFNNTSSDTRETGLGDVAPYMYPIVNGIHHEYHDYIKFYEDEHGIAFMTSDKRVKIDVSIVLELRSSADQEAALNYLENTIPMQRGEYIHGVIARYLLPTHFLTILRNTLYIDQLKEIEKTPIAMKQSLMREINSAFSKHLVKYGMGNITTRYLHGDINKPFYIYNRYYNIIYFQVTGLPQKTDGEKKGEVYSKHTVTLDAFFEFYKPITYIMKSPEVVCGHIFEDVVKISNYLDKDLNSKPVGLVDNVKKTTYHTPTSVQADHKEVIWRETDIYVMSNEDHINLEEWIEEKELQNILKLMKICTETEFKNCFRIDVYEGDNILDSSYFEIINKTQIALYDTNPSYLYTVYLLVDKVEANNLNRKYGISDNDLFDDVDIVNRHINLSNNKLIIEAT